VPRNQWYGFRTPRTLGSDSTWYRTNSIGGKYLIVAATVQLVALLVIWTGWHADAPNLMVRYGGALTAVPLVVAVIAWFLKTRDI
jgi:uncharacterized membrane protein